MPDYCKHLKSALPAVASIAVLAIGPSSFGAAYEGFDLAAPDGTTLVGQPASGSGYTGSWVGDETHTYSTDGLSMSGLATTGGSAAFNGDSTAQTTSLNLSDAYDSGTVYGSHLVRTGVAMNNANDDAVRDVMWTDNVEDSDGTASFALSNKEYRADNGGVRISTAGGSTLKGAADGQPLAADTTYLTLFEAGLDDQDDAENGQQQSLTMWMLDAAQYDNFREGGLSVSELNSAATGTGAQQVTQRAAASQTQDRSITVSTLFSHQPMDEAVRYDELRLSSQSLNDVTPVPEPASLALMGLGIAGLAGRRRRR